MTVYSQPEIQTLAGQLRDEDANLSAAQLTLLFKCSQNVASMESDCEGREEPNTVQVLLLLLAQTLHNIS